MSDFKPSTREEFDAMWTLMNETGRKEYAWKVSQLADAREMLLRADEARSFEEDVARAHNEATSRYGDALAAEFARKEKK